MKTRLIVALYLSGLAALLLARFGLAAQDPGSMASRVQRPASCANGEVLTYNSTSQQYECQPAGGGGVPAGDAGTERVAGRNATAGGVSPR